MSQLAIGLVRTPVHSQSAKLQPFYKHLRIATSFLLSRSIGFVQFFNSICQISPFCICKHHQFDTLTLLTRECNGFVQFFNSTPAVWPFSSQAWLSWLRSLNTLNLKLCQSETVGFSWSPPKFTDLYVPQPIGILSALAANFSFLRQVHLVRHLRNIQQKCSCSLCCKFSPKGLNMVGNYIFVK